MHASSLRRVFVGVLATVPLGVALACVPWGSCPTNPYSATVFPDASSAPDGGTADVAMEAGLTDAGSADALDPCHQGCPYNGPDGGWLQSCSSNASDGAVSYECNYSTVCTGGRRPRGHRAAAVACGNVAGRYFAQQAGLEAASVRAFAELGDELQSRGAPVSLVRAAKRAACDEVRHADSVGRLARAFGGSIPAVKPPRTAINRTRSLTAMAAHNAVEGCVRETYAALVAEYQSRTASDPSVRATMARVARDETRHAALAFRVQAWASERMDAVGRARINAARTRAIASLRAELHAEPPADLLRDAGVPPAGVALAMLDGLERALWR